MLRKEGELMTVNFKFCCEGIWERLNSTVFLRQDDTCKEIYARDSKNNLVFYCQRCGKEIKITVEMDEND